MTKANESKEVFNITNINVIPVVNRSIINKVEVSNLSVRDLINFFTISICINCLSNLTEVDMLIYFSHNNSLFL